MTGKFHAAAARSLAVLAFLCGPSSSHAAGRPEAFEQLEFQAGVGPSRPAQPRPGPAASASGIPARAGGVAIGAPLDLRFFGSGDDIREEAKADWERRLKQNGGLPSLVPLAPLDPARDILLCIPGHGQNFQDMRELAKLADTYQVLIAVVDDGKSMDRNAAGLADLADALAALAGGRGAGDGGRGPELRLVGHSMGGGIGQLLLQELVDRKKLYDGPGSVFSRVIFVGIDSIWRGVDAPWLMAPGVGPLSQYGIPSLANGGPVMVRIERVSMPANVTTHFVTTHHKLSTSPQMRHFEPIANWYSGELGAGELRKLWDFLRKGESDLNKLDDFAMGGLVRKHGLKNLWRTLARDADYPAHAAGIKEAAVRAGSEAEFAAGYDAALEKIVDTFNVPDHTAFMWEDPAFLPRIRERLGK